MMLDNKPKVSDQLMRNSMLWPFLIIATLHCFVEWRGWIAWQHVTKPLLMPALAWVVWQHRILLNRQILTGLLVALLLSWLGDSMLMYQDRKPTYFMLGLVSFLLAHLSYIYLFLRLKAHKRIYSNRTVWKLILGLLLVAFGVTMFLLLRPGLGTLTIPVAIYSTAITTMSITALLRYGYTNSLSFRQILIGAMLFVLSDSILATNKFYEAIPQSGLLIMLTYLGAQCLIVCGSINHHSNGQKA